MGLLASVSDTSEGTIRPALECRGIDTDGLCSKAQSPLIYEISGADECLDQRTRRLGPGARDLALPETVPEAYCGAKMALIYPVWMPTAVVVARRLKASGTRLAVDFQHDVDTLADAADLLELCDYVFLNTESLMRLTDVDTTEGAAAALRNAAGEATIVVKMGLGGSLVCPPSSGSAIRVPAFLSDFRLTVGAGDAYDAAFLTATLDAGPDAADGPRRAGFYASMVAAAVVESASYDPASVLEDVDCLEGRQPVFLTPERARQIQVYVAGHFHSAPLRSLIEEAAATVEHLGDAGVCPSPGRGTGGQRRPHASPSLSGGRRGPPPVSRGRGGAGRGEPRRDFLRNWIGR